MICAISPAKLRSLSIISSTLISFEMFKTCAHMEMGQCLYIASGRSEQACQLWFHSRVEFFHMETLVLDAIYAAVGLRHKWKLNS